VLKVVLVDPEIPWNTGNVGRTCVAVGAELHLVGRLGFSLSERRIKRAGMDYWARLDLHLHDSWEAFERTLAPDAQLAFFSPAGTKTVWDAPFGKNDYLVFGSESRGLPEAITSAVADRIYRIPMVPGNRSLNLSSSVAVALYEAVRKVNKNNDLSLGQ
jgi:tRNA (cytidine/uridine-2'-O-)-methyltransferase